MRLTEVEVKALAVVHELGRAKLATIKRAYASRHGVKLKAKTLSGLWARRLVNFGWFSELYAVTPKGAAELALLRPSLFERADQARAA